VPRDVQAEVTKWVKDLGVSKQDMEVLTANDNADEDHSAMFEQIFLKYGNTPEAEAMILNGARESLDMMGTFYDALNQEMMRCQ
jgi:pyrroloquinoline quinone (PQQ) biosynthesis protein C